ncbi:hypothetical protein GYA49_01535 [Candidatus Beckwithbacteria bacterium]|nr:hypothetical protein [Candidatus Beckwithbacteria bacterium]
MKFTDSHYFTLLLIFAVIVIAAFGLFSLLSGGLNKSGNILGQKHKVGTYQIESDQQVSVSIPFTMRFNVDTKGKAVNAVGLYVNFDPNMIEIINLETAQSFCQFYPENKFSNSEGTISIGCGAPNPGFTGKNTIAVVKFYPKNLGETIIKVLPKSQILLNDGKGTDIFSGPIEHKITILNSI